MDVMNKTKEYAKKYEQCKSVVIKWESAFAKEKGREPNREDFRGAPSEVHIAYRNYVEIKRFLTEFSSKGIDSLYMASESAVKKKPVESPLRIFRKNGQAIKSSSKFSPSPHSKALRANSSSANEIEGIHPLSPSPKKLNSCHSKQAGMQTPSPKTKITTSRLSLKTTPPRLLRKLTPKKSGAAAFGKLTSKLYAETGLKKSSQVKIPRGKISGNQDELDNDPSFSIDSILDDVKKTVESFDKDDFDNFAPDSTFESSFGDIGKIRCGNSPAVPLSLEERLEKHSLFSGLRHRKPRKIDSGWLERCMADNIETDEPENMPLPPGPAKQIVSTCLPIAGLDSEAQKNPIAATTAPKATNQHAVTHSLVSPNTRSRTRAQVQTSQKKITRPAKAVAQKPVESSTKRKASAMSAYDFIDDSTGSGTSSKKGKKRIKLTVKEATEKKIKTGIAEDNYVKIDIGKKRFVRGKRKMTGIQHKRLDRKIKGRQAAAEEKIKLVKCRKCAGVGHFAKFCVQVMAQKDDEPEDIDDSPFPTLEEAARMFKNKKAAEASKGRVNIYKDTTAEVTITEPEKEDSSQSDDPDSAEHEAKLVLVAHDDEDDQSSASQLNLSASSDSDLTLNNTFAAGLDTSAPVKVRSVQPVLPLTSELSESDDKMLRDGLKLFGYSEFRSGQKEAVTKVLRGESTLVVLSTGSGKSLCYLLPAYLYAKKYPGVITICVSPLVSLMEDQVQSIPSFLSGVCLHTNMTQKQRDVIIEKIRQKKVQVLLVSPEAVCSGLFGLLRKANEFPQVAFACIDEVHCVSEWSHNFRPSYLRLCKILRDRLNVQAILGLTATATSRTMTSICDHIAVDPSSAVRGEIVPSNLRLSCSRDLDREQALLTLLQSDRFADCDSMIIYCTRREQCERIAILIRTYLKSKTGGLVNDSRRKLSADCEPYHAGMTAARRRAVQNNFMSGRIRIVVATVAFGMGIDKSDIRAVIHYTMPKTFESYVQEIGRAGRDGMPAECHLFLDSSKGKDICELRRHIYSNSVDRPTIRKLLSNVFTHCACIKKEKSKEAKKAKEEIQCPGHEISFSVEETVHELDLPDENIETLLCYLELHEKKLIELLPKCYQKCTIQSYGGTKLLKIAANRCPPLAAAIALQKTRKKFKDTDMHVEFNFVEVSTMLGWDSGEVRRELKSLEWTGTQFDEAGKPTKFRKSGILVDFSELAYRMIAPGTLSDDDSDAVLNFLHGRNSEQERTELFQLNRLYQSLYRFVTVEWRNSAQKWGDSANLFFLRNRKQLRNKILKQLASCYPCSLLSTAAVSQTLSYQVSKKNRVDRITSLRPNSPIPRNSCKTVDIVCQAADEMKSDNLKKLIVEYFNDSNVSAPADWKPPQIGSDSEKEDAIRQDIRKLLHSHGDNDFSSRAIAKILQGISSPCFPAEDWSRNRAFWRRHLDVDFHFLCQIAAQEI